MAMGQQRSLLGQRRQVRRCAIALVPFEAISWMERAQFFHDVIAGNLSDNRCRRDREMPPVALDHRRLRQLQSRYPPLAVDQHAGWDEYQRLDRTLARQHRCPIHVGRSTSATSPALYLFGRASSK